MSLDRSVPLGDAVKSFFTRYLSGELGATALTIASYRDTMRLFLRFVTERSQRSIASCTWEEASPEAVLAFLEHLETARKNTGNTRNTRFAALRTFFGFAATVDPALVAAATRVHAIPFKRVPARAVVYLSEEELTAILDAPDRTKAKGRRDYLTMALLYETAARARELIAIRPSDCRLDRAPWVRLFGKGRKERIVPISVNCARHITEHLREHDRLHDDDKPLLRNYQGEALGTSGLARLVKQHQRRAAARAQALSKKRVSPHTFRHTKAMHLFQAGVSIVTIRDILGHASFASLHFYVQADSESKRRALEQAGVKTSKPGKGLPPPDLLEWLERL